MNNEINSSSIVPLYKQVSHIIMDDIISKRLNEGDKLPSELTLMSTYGVSRVTIRSAIAELVDDGLLVRSQGKGTFVAAQKSKRFVNDLPGLTKTCQQLGKTLISKVLSVNYAYPTHSESEFLNINENEQIIETKRLRIIDGNPAIIETNHYIKEFEFLFHENLEGSLFEILVQHDIHVANNTRTLEIGYADSTEISLLNVKANTPLLLFKDSQSDSNGRPIFISKQIYNTQNMIFYL